MTTVKDSWKKVGEDINEIGRDIKNTEFGKNMKQLGKDLGRSLVKTVKYGIRTVNEWAAEDDPEEPVEPAEEASFSAEEPEKEQSDG